MKDRLRFRMVKGLTQTTGQNSQRGNDEKNKNYPTVEKMLPLVL